MTATTDNVTFETAKLLKQAGFDRKTKRGYTDDGKLVEYMADYPAPHLWAALKWMREKHRIHVGVSRKHWGNMGWTCLLVHTEGKVAVPQESLYAIRKNESGYPKEYPTVFATYETAADAGIAEAARYLITKQTKR